MKIEKKVVGANVNAQQLAVVFSTDESLGEIGPFAVDVPFRDGAFISGDDLDAHIMGFAPREEFSRRLAIKNMSDEERTAIQKLVAPVVAPQPRPIQEKPTPEERVARLIGAEQVLGFIDNYAGVCRQANVSIGKHIELLYAAKLAAANARLLKGTSNPLLQADVDAGYAKSQVEAASRIVDTAAASDALLAQIEVIRLNAKNRVRAGADIVEWRAAARDAVIAMDDLASIPAGELPIVKKATK